MDESGEYTIPQNETVKITPSPVHELSYSHTVLLAETFLVTENAELQYTRYITGEGNRVFFDMMLSTEAHAVIKDIGWKTLRELFEKNLDSIEQDPFGTQSLDIGKDNPGAHERRSINPISRELEKLIGMPVAIKGTGIGLSPGHPDREGLRAQYQLMRTLQLRANTLLTDETKNIVEFAPVYGVIKYPVNRREKYQEWLLMKRYDNAKWVEDRIMSGPAWHRHGLSYRGFDPREHPRLANAIGSPFGDWVELVLSLRHRGLPVSDLSGRNVLYYPGEDRLNRYAIIDQKVYGAT